MILALALVLLAQTVTATPPPVKFQGGFGRPAGTARVVITQDDLAARPTPAPTPFVPGLTKPAVPAASVPLQPSPATVQDDEALWRGRYAAARAKLDTALAHLRDAERAAGDVVSIGGRVGSGPSQAHRIMAQARDNALLPYRLAVEEAAREVEAVRSACRVTYGCAPGWVRD